ncbi:MAG: hypothetical protein PHH26_03365 [Candidatus Thermoplasmatota archaeon]|nr:hypothetical protein [Candidatus Thermoplasmatota archaeon]
MKREMLAPIAILIATLLVVGVIGATSFNGKIPGNWTLDQNEAEASYQKAEVNSSGTATPFSGFSASMELGGNGTIQVRAQLVYVVGAVRVSIQQEGEILKSSESIMAGIGGAFSIKGSFPAGRYVVRVDAPAGICTGAVYVLGEW